MPGQQQQQQSEILPLHGKPGTSTVTQWTAQAQCFLRTLLKRTSSSRTLLVIVSFLALYLLSHSYSGDSTGHGAERLGNSNYHGDGTNKERVVMNKNGVFKSKAAVAGALSADKLRERERMLMEWDQRSNYRTDLADVGPGRVSSFPASLFVSPKSNSNSGPGSSSSSPSSSLSSSSSGSSALLSSSSGAGGINTGPASKYVPITAVILSWKRKEGVKAVVAHLRKYPFIQEILIWNNNPDVVLSTTHDFPSNTTTQTWPSISVFNSVANLHDFSKYTTCTLAKYDHCYIQDDDWINLSLDSMYSLMVDHPSSLITSTIPAMAAQQRSWTFQNPQLGLHTGFSWLGAGSFMPKKAVFKFLMQLGGSNLWKERVQLGDLFFALWRNQYPVVLSHALAPLDQSSSWSGRIDQWSVVYEHMTDAMFRLTTVLSGTGVVHGSPHRVGAKSDFVADEEMLAFKDRHTRSSCSNDKCLFQTNIDMFPQPESIKWNPDTSNPSTTSPTTTTTTQHRDLLQAHEARFKSLNYPKPEFVAMHTYHYAVDQDLSTCWQSFHPLEKGGYFGLRFVLPLLELGERAKSIEVWSTFETTLVHLGKFMVVKASVDGTNWMTCTGETERATGSIRMKDLRCTDVGRKIGIQLDTRGIQFLRFEMKEPTTNPIEICGIRVGDMLL
ncbi:hypothetical protein BKA57DRAFT_529253 [Linnemannia elongata]|nr:hypothetical protein BKA57DRAFT_529253 [Linnemannia elongata]